MAKRLQGASYFRLGRDVRVFVIFLGAVLNQPLFTLGVVALVMNVEVVRRGRDLQAGCNVAKNECPSPDYSRHGVKEVVSVD